MQRLSVNSQGSRTCGLEQNYEMFPQVNRQSQLDREINLGMEGKQEARAILRKDYLAFIDDIRGKDIKLRMAEGNLELKAKFEACDPETRLLLVSDLETTLGRQESAKIRVSDTVSLTTVVKNK